MAQQTHETPDILPNNVRQDMTVLGAAFADGEELQVALRIDNGQFVGKKVLHSFNVRDDKSGFLNAAAVPTSVLAGGDVKKWLNDKAPSIRVSANVKKRITMYLPEHDKWVEVDSPPRGKSKFAVKYRMSEFDRPEEEDELGMDSTFWEKRQSLEQQAA